MSEAQNNQDERNLKAEHSEGVNSDRDRENLESSQKNSGSETETAVDSETAGDKKTDKEMEETAAVEPVVLTNEEIIDLKKKAEERDSFLDQLLRTRAEFMNYQKRMHKENESTAQFAIQNLILDLFPELDNFDRALKLADNSKDFDKLVEGIKLIKDQLFKVLGKYGVKSMETVGKAFDPNLHEAVMEEENNELPHHTITDELQKGFLLKERVIRPSKVKVSKRTIEEEETEDV
ncbi:MAG: nucleotide exchange factor GrpE [Planctomycetes bacterium GWA2_40_7]|nr:MAG: nucleotide exchange factor GrpE [Planctomycetes bacterium GWA2_40_7]OHB47422.1 MAG: nucleotide exchange factor GrpE [Planctomycetes bacterium GWF2_40_8]OHB86645.1 MAG: nucleotide exchange factor GrpE [Planctomycetes bacterium RIFCSPHIGHO2_02_FULL_40_12]OHC01416.1 MAG: nucleotide exchange factor GrpE [Planctomycetes bacterium RIFCSPLOWO2_12_FULL_40_19]